MTDIIAKAEAAARESREVAAAYRARGEDVLAEEMDAAAEDWAASAEHARSARLHFIGAMKRSNRRRTEAA